MNNGTSVIYIVKLSTETFQPPIVFCVLYLRIVIFASELRGSFLTRIESLSTYSNVGLHVPDCINSSLYPLHRLPEVAQAVATSSSKLEKGFSIARERRRVQTPNTLIVYTVL